MIYLLRCIVLSNFVVASSVDEYFRMCFGRSHAVANKEIPFPWDFISCAALVEFSFWFSLCARLKEIFFLYIIYVCILYICGFLVLLYLQLKIFIVMWFFFFFCWTDGCVWVRVSAVVGHCVLACCWHSGSQRIDHTHKLCYNVKHREKKTYFIWEMHTKNRCVVHWRLYIIFYIVNIHS